jgi:hypothetical protein
MTVVLPADDLVELHPANEEAKGVNTTACPVSFKNLRREFVFSIAYKYFFM